MMPVRDDLGITPLKCPYCKIPMRLTCGNPGFSYWSCENCHKEFECRSMEKGAMFDCRCFNIPKEEVTNLVYWRQLDATRNSIQMVGQANFSHKELQGKSCNDIQDMLMLQKGINWNNYPTYLKRGQWLFAVARP